MLFKNCLMLIFVFKIFPEDWMWYDEWCIPCLNMRNCTWQTYFQELFGMCHFVTSPHLHSKERQLQAFLLRHHFYKVATNLSLVTTLDISPLLKAVGAILSRFNDILYTVSVQARFPSWDGVFTIWPLLTPNDVWPIKSSCPQRGTLRDLSRFPCLQIFPQLTPKSICDLH